MTTTLRALGAAILLACATLSPAIAATPKAHAVKAPTVTADTLVNIKNFDFNPMNVTISVGGRVTWKNLDGEPHTVTALDGSFRSGGLDQNDSFTFKFTKAGVYKYLCTIHPQMVATVTVKP